MNFDFQKARELMVANQLKPNKINKPIILELSVKIYNLPLFIIGETVIRFPIFLKYSAFPEVAELTIK